MSAGRTFGRAHDWMGCAFHSAGCCDSLGLTLEVLVYGTYWYSGITHYFTGSRTVKVFIN